MAGGLKKKEFLFFAILLLLAALAWAGISAARRMQPSGSIRITVDGQEYGVYPLSKDARIAINDTNVCQIRGGRATMIQAACPDHLCMRQPAVDQNGGLIICLPNRVVIEGIAAKDTPKDPAVDAIG